MHGLFPRIGLCQARQVDCQAFKHRVSAIPPGGNSVLGQADLGGRAQLLTSRLLGLEPTAHSAGNSVFGIIGGIIWLLLGGVREGPAVLILVPEEVEVRV